MAITKKNKTLTNNKDVRSAADKAINIVRDSSGRQKVEFDTTIARNDRNLRVDSNESDIVTATVDLADGSYKSFDAFQAYLNEKKLTAKNKKVKVKIVADNGAVYTTKIKAGEITPNSKLRQMHEFMFENCDMARVTDAGADKLNIMTATQSVSGGTRHNVYNDAEVEANDDIKRAFLGTAAQRDYFKGNSFTVEEVPNFSDTKLGIFARSVGGMIKNNAVKLGVIGAGAGILATKGTALGAGVIAAVTNPATWAAVGTFAAGAAPVVAAAVGAIALTKWVGKEFSRAKAAAMSTP